MDHSNKPECNYSSGHPESGPGALKQQAYKLFKQNQNSTTAFDIFNQVAAQGDSEGSYAVGCMYLYGYAVAQNPDKAATFLIKAYKQGYDLALMGIAKLHESGYHFPAGSFFTSSALECYERLYTKHKLDMVRQKLEQIASDTINYTLDDRIQAKMIIAPESSEEGDKFKQVYHNVLKLVKTARNNKDEAPEPRENVSLQHLVGLNGIKREIEKLESLVKFDNIRSQKGFKRLNTSYHSVFYGNPGTGKTEVARAMGKIFYDSGFLKTDKVIEVDRGSLTGEFLGMTERITNDAIKSAMDGVLFIDEAYGLSSLDSGRDYGRHIVNILVKAMEDHRDRMVVILAGYKDEMDIFLRTNPGLKSRIRNHWHFSDYNTQELVHIFESLAYRNNFVLTPETLNTVNMLMKQSLRLADKDLGNGRFVRNAFEKALENMARRVMQHGGNDYDLLQTIEFCDIPTLEQITGKTFRPYSP